MNSRMMKRVWLGIGCSVLVPLALVGCSKGDDTAKESVSKNTPEAAQPAKPPEPVTIRIFMETGYGNDAFFNEVFVQPVKAKYPYITLERVLPAPGQTYQMLPGMQDIPDLVVQGIGAAIEFQDMKLASDLTELAKKHKFDWNQIKPVVVDGYKSLDGKQILGIPWYGNLYALYYNKDIFDKFGVSYPKDGMFWNDVIALAGKVSRVDNGTTYYGYDIDNPHRISFPLSITAVDIRTNKPNVDTDPQWKKVFQLAKDIYSVPGNNPPSMNGATRFYKDRNVAMTGHVNIFGPLTDKDGEGLNWDVAQYPSYPERPNIYGRVDVGGLMIPVTSKHKDDAFLVAAHIASPEVQTLMVRKHARLSPLNDTKLQSQFGAEIPKVQGKNIAGIFKSEFAPYTNKQHPLEGTAMGIVKTKMSDVAFKNKDINTALREAEEEISKLPLTR